jgi:hypothetical protein
MSGAAQGGVLSVAVGVPALSVPLPASGAAAAAAAPSSVASTDDPHLGEEHDRLFRAAPGAEELGSDDEESFSALDGPEDADGRPTRQQAEAPETAPRPDEPPPGVAPRAPIQFGDFTGAMLGPSPPPYLYDVDEAGRSYPWEVLL